MESFSKNAGIGGGGMYLRGTAKKDSTAEPQELRIGRPLDASCVNSQLEVAALLLPSSSGGWSRSGLLTFTQIVKMISLTFCFWT